VGLGLVGWRWLGVVGRCRMASGRNDAEARA